MSRLVTVKSNKYGLIVRLQDKVPFQELLLEVQRTFTDTVNFFGKTKLAVSFEGRILTKDQEQQLIDMISKTAQIEIVCIIDTDEKRETMYKRLVEESLEQIAARDGLFCKGTLHRKQVLESETSIVILGDVETGATIAAKGNIIVLGALKGAAHAGAAGNQDSFILSLSMQAKQLKIGNLSAQCCIMNENENMSMGPQIAVANGTEISVKPVYL